MVNIRQLTQQDFSQWKSIRLDMLKQVPEAFGASFEEDSLYVSSDYFDGFTDRHRVWIDRCEEKERHL